MVEYLIANLWLCWLIVSVLCLVLELCSGDLYVICVAFGAMIGCLCAMMNLPLWAQILAFAVASVVCIFFIRPSLVRMLHSGGEDRKSNIDALVGKQATVKETVEANGYGYVKVAGDLWRCVSADGTEIPKGTKVTVTGYDSITLTVSL